MRKEDFTFTVYSDSQVGLLADIALLLSHRKLVMCGMNVSPSHLDRIHRFTIVVNGEADIVQQMVYHLTEHPHVINVSCYSEDEIDWLELALYKIPTSVLAKFSEVEELFYQHGASAVVMRSDYTVFEATGHCEELDRLVRGLRPYGLVEYVRSARVAIVKAREGWAGIY